MHRRDLITEGPEELPYKPAFVEDVDRGLWGVFVKVSDPGEQHPVDHVYLSRGDEVTVMFAATNR